MDCRYRGTQENLVDWTLRWWWWGGSSRVDTSRFQCQNIKEIKEENDVKLNEDEGKKIVWSATIFFFSFLSTKEIENPFSLLTRFFFTYRRQQRRLS